MDKIIADVHLLVEAERERKGLPKWDWLAPKRTLRPDTWRAIWRREHRIKLKAMGMSTGK